MRCGDLVWPSQTSFDPSTSTANHTVYGNQVEVYHNGVGGDAYGYYASMNGTSPGLQYGAYITGEDRNYFSGNVGIGTTAPTTKLHIASTTSPAFRLEDGTQLAGRVLTTDANGNATWAAPAGAGWGLTGNSGTVDGTNFIGTTDNIPFNIRVNNQRSGRIETDAFIGANQANTLYGYRTGNSITGNNNSAFGTNAMLSAENASDNSAFGSTALYSNTTGNGNTGIGARALLNNTIGINNTAVGNWALRANTTASNNSAIGYSAMYSNTIGTNNTAIGNNAMYSNVAGSRATAIGFGSMYYANNTATSFTNFNVAVGYEALRGSTTASNNTGINNTALGSSALLANSCASANTAIGYRALESQGTFLNGGTQYVFYNVALGFEALLNNQPTAISNGRENTALGSRALRANTTGYNNTATGNGALYFNTTGYFNTADGHFALFSNVGGLFNTATGHRSLYSNTSGNSNTACGRSALQGVTTSSGNTGLGSSAGTNGGGGVSITTGFYNTFIGYNTTSDLANRNNSIAIGGNSNLAFGGDNRVRIGNASMTSIGGQVGWTTISDERTKTDYREDVKGLEFIMKLKPLTYSYDVDNENELMWGKKTFAKSENLEDEKAKDGALSPNTVEWSSKYDIEKMRFSGFRAQEVARIAKEIGFEFSGVDKPQDEGGLYGIRYAEFTVPLVKAVQEQQQQIETLKAENEKLNILVNKISTENASLKSDIELIKQQLGIGVEANK